jgi:hypothetical protein
MKAVSPTFKVGVPSSSMVSEPRIPLSNSSKSRYVSSMSVFHSARRSRAAQTARTGPNIQQSQSSSNGTVSRAAPVRRQRPA